MYNYVCIAIYTKERNTWFALCMVPVGKIVYAWRLYLHCSPSSQLRGFSSTFDWRVPNMGLPWFTSLPHDSHDLPSGKLT